MTHSLKHTIDAFVELVTRSSAPAEALASLETPRLEHVAIRSQVETRFPNFGLYKAPDVDSSAELSVGDAIDDITDIAVDLSEVQWLWENAGEGEARTQFRLSFAVHWGAHLRILQWYSDAIRQEI